MPLDPSDKFIVGTSRLEKKTVGQMIQDFVAAGHTGYPELTERMRETSPMKWGLNVWMNNSWVNGIEGIQKGEIDRLSSEAAKSISSHNRWIETQISRAIGSGFIDKI